MLQNSRIIVYFCHQVTKSNSDNEVTMEEITTTEETSLSEAVTAVTHDCPLPAHECKKAIMGVHDAMYVLGGKWKIYIIAALLFGPKRYSDLLRDINGISGKVLSRELKEMETNRLLTRTVSGTAPLTVTYALTPYGESTKAIIGILAEWGKSHRNYIISEPQR